MFLIRHYLNMDGGIWGSVRPAPSWRSDETSPVDQGHHWSAHIYFPSLEDVSSGIFQTRCDAAAN